MLKTDSLNARTHSLTHSFTSSSCFLSLFFGGVLLQVRGDSVRAAPEPFLVRPGSGGHRGDGRAVHHGGQRRNLRGHRRRCHRVVLGAPRCHGARGRAQRLRRGGLSALLPG